MKIHNSLARKVSTLFFSLLLFVCLSVGINNADANGQVQPLVNTQWLADNIKADNMRLVHMATPGGKKEHFDMKHVPGSVYLGIGDLMGVMGNGSTPPDKAGFEALMSRLGISNDTHVVVLGSEGNPFIAGTFWLMKYFGHDKVSMLDGGVKKWMGEKRATTGEATKVQATKYSATPDNSLYANADEVLKNINNKKAAIVDTRSDGEYTGKDNSTQNKRTGNIPSSIHMDFYSTNLNPDGTFKSAKDLKAEYEAKGVTSDKEVITYCQGGIRAAHTLFVLKYMLDYPNVKNYVGSWGEWGSRLDFKKYPADNETIHTK
jgi:thiosulfate/3-mercaptopyruvate sulfurtransferase